ncbi:MAG: FkbM family methyltransferase [Thioalkalivibrionaceae bacterium]
MRPGMNLGHAAAGLAIGAADGFRSATGLLRSLWVYRRPFRQRALRRLYQPFVPRGGLVFDIGAHLGDRSIAFDRLGARVVAFEPQTRLHRWFAIGHPARRRIELRSEALGSQTGFACLAVSTRHPTVSTLSRRFINDVSRPGYGFEDVNWDREAAVAVSTLDEMIAFYGRPDFCKIDVEGFEADVLAGLSQPLSALSFEFVRGAEQVALSAVDRLRTLGEYEFNIVLGERRDWIWPMWQPAASVCERLATLPPAWRSGDIYARLIDASATTTKPV